MVSATAQLSSANRDHRVILSGITWEMYEGLVDQVERAGRRLVLTYDDGELEVEMPSEIYELIKAFVRGMLEQYLIDAKTPFLPVGQTTYKRRLLGKGLEADESYYLSNLNHISQAGDNDLERVPPPDLAIEVEVTMPLLDKLPVYAAVGIPGSCGISMSPGRRAFSGSRMAHTWRCLRVERFHSSPLRC